MRIGRLVSFLRTFWYCYNCPVGSPIVNCGCNRGFVLRYLSENLCIVLWVNVNCFAAVVIQIFVTEWRYILLFACSLPLDVLALLCHFLRSGVCFDCISHWMVLRVLFGSFIEHYTFASTTLTYFAILLTSYGAKGLRLRRWLVVQLSSGGLRVEVFLAHIVKVRRCVHSRYFT